MEVNKNKVLRTPYQKKVAARQNAIYNRYKELASNKENSKMMVMRLIASEYDINSYSTIYNIINKKEGKK